MADRASVFRLMVEGNSVHGINRLTGFSRGTIGRLLLDLGGVCATYLDHTLRNLPCKRIQCDEIYSTVGHGRHAVWTWTAICIDTRLIACWSLGDRTYRTAKPFMHELRARTVGRIHMTTDQLSSYPVAVREAFGDDIDYGVLCWEEGKRGAIPGKVLGNPDPRIMHNNYVERHNGTMRDSMRRFARRSICQSKSMKHHWAALASYFMHYNFCRPNMALQTSWHITPAMAAGLTDHVWNAEDVCLMLEDRPRTIGAPLRWKLNIRPNFRVQIPEHGVPASDPRRFVRRAAAVV